MATAMKTAEIDWRASGVLTELKLLIGTAATLKLIAERGGGPLYLPQTVTADCELARIVGLEDAARIVARWGGRRILEIPTGHGYGHTARIDRGQVKALLDQGLSKRRIARALGCSSRHVRTIAAEIATGREPAGRGRGAEPQRQLDLLDWLARS
ncbi:MAG: hypothetical protein GC168_20545 [Candidatus Hydrogenedens sp.]|nr:hypothetical protein [Candidatus Hydrogenedens sp.]